MLDCLIAWQFVANEAYQHEGIEAVEGLRTPIAQALLIAEVHQVLDNWRGPQSLANLLAGDQQPLNAKQALAICHRWGAKAALQSKRTQLPATNA